MRRRVGVAGAVRAVLVEMDAWGCGVGGAEAVVTKGATK